MTNIRQNPDGKRHFRIVKAMTFLVLREAYEIWKYYNKEQKEDTCFQIITTMETVTKRNK